MVYTQTLAPTTPNPIDLQSRFCSGEECFADPHSVRIRVQAEFIQTAEKAMKFMNGGDFNSVTVTAVAEYTLLNEDGVEMEDLLLRGCHAEIANTGHVRFVFPFRCARDQGWTQQQWSIEELAQMAVEKPLSQQMQRKYAH